MAKEQVFFLLKLNCFHKIYKIYLKNPQNLFEKSAVCYDYLPSEGLLLSSLSPLPLLVRFMGLLSSASPPPRSFIRSIMLSMCGERMLNGGWGPLPPLSNRRPPPSPSRSSRSSSSLASFIRSMRSLYGLLSARLIPPSRRDSGDTMFMPGNAAEYAEISFNAFLLKIRTRNFLFYGFFRLVILFSNLYCRCSFLKISLFLYGIKPSLVYCNPCNEEPCSTTVLIYR